MRSITFLSHGLPVSVKTDVFCCSKKQSVNVTLYLAYRIKNGGGACVGAQLHKISVIEKKGQDRLLGRDMWERWMGTRLMREIGMERNERWTHPKAVVALLLSSLETLASFFAIKPVCFLHQSVKANYAVVNINSYVALSVFTLPVSENYLSSLKLSGFLMISEEWEVQQSA